MEAMIEVRKLCKSFVVNKKQNHVLRNVNLSIYKGEFIAVMGPSGSGKSTLLYTISGMDHINSGTVEFDHKEINAYADELLRKFQITSIAGHSIQEVSGGELQRACIARAMINQPQILFADEPTGALNSSNAKEVMDMFSKVHEQGTTILMVTHDVKVASYAQRICYINDGKIESNLDIGVLRHADELKEREKKVYSWLMEKGW